MAALATATGRKRTTDLSVARNELIKKGLVYPPERGYIAFTAGYGRVHPAPGVMDGPHIS